jgi:hypothetical protein
MNESDYSNPAGPELDQHLQSLRSEPPQPRSQLVPHILRKARWQRAIRAPLHAAGGLVGAVAEGIGVLIGAGRGPRS